MVLSYALRGSTGFGAAAAMPLLGLVIPLKVLIPAWTLIGLVASITLFGRDRRHVAWGDIARLVPTCVIGILVGLYLFKTLDSAVLAKGLGVLVLLYGLCSLLASWRPPARWSVSPRVAAPIVGLVGGIVGTTFGTMASVFFAIYFDVIRMAKENFRATMTAILVALGVARGAGYWAVGGIYARRARDHGHRAADDAGRYLHRQSRPHRIERARVPAPGQRRADRERPGAPGEERLKPPVTQGYGLA